jgi:uncharacterized protein (TIGR03067 family)
MHHLIRQCLVAGAVACALGCSNSDPIRGTYEIVRSETEKTLVAKGDKGWADRTFKFESGETTITFADGEVVKGSYKLDLTKTPPQIDLIAPMKEGKDYVTYGIFKLEGDTLLICQAKQESERPREFSVAAGGTVRLMTFKKKE